MHSVDYTVAMSVRPSVRYTPVSVETAKHILKLVSPSTPCQFTVTNGITIFCEGLVPSVFKAAHVTPLLKKADLDSADAKSYRPISNLSVV